MPFALSRHKKFQTETLPKAEFRFLLLGEVGEKNSSKGRDGILPTFWREGNFQVFGSGIFCLEKGSDFGCVGTGLWRGVEEFWEEASREGFEVELERGLNVLEIFGREEFFPGRSGFVCELGDGTLCDL
jgi:hypothetical protein